MTTETLFDNSLEGELDSYDDTESNHLSFEDYLRLPNFEKRERYFELSDNDQEVAYARMSYEDRLTLLTPLQKELYERLSQQIPHANEYMLTKYSSLSSHTLSMLLASTRLVAPKTDDRSRIIQATRTTGGSSITFNMYSSSGNPSNAGRFKVYKQVIEFYPDYIFHRGGNTSNLLTYVNMEDKKLYKPSLSKDRVRVVCSCNDYYFKYSFINWERGCKYGRKPLKYVNKSVEPSHTHRNSRHLPGCCKHIMAAIRELQSRNLIQS